GWLPWRRHGSSGGSRPVPALPPEVIRWDIEISQRAALRPARSGARDAAYQEGAAPMPVLVALGSFATTLLGGMAALRIGDRRHLVVGLGAGLMLGVVLFDLLPEALAEQPGYLFGVPVVMLATMAGFLALHVIERSAPVHRGHEAEYAGHQHHPGVGMLAASRLVGHRLADGLAIRAAL